MSESTSTPSPLSGTNPDSISELFARDPLEWTEADMVRMVEHLRKQRKDYEANPEAKAAKPKKASVKADLSHIKSGTDLLATLNLAPKGDADA